MNCILILLDGVRVDWLDKSTKFKELKTKGCFFPNVITYAPYTFAAMHAIFSGSYGADNGVNAYYSSKKFKKGEFKTITQCFKEKGYYTEADIDTEVSVPYDGFDKVNVHDEYNDDLVSLHKGLIGKANDKGKFFLYLVYDKTHSVTVGHAKEFSDFDDAFFSKKEENSKLYEEAFFKASDYVSEIYSYLENLGILEDTFLLIFSDHGTSVGEKKGELLYGSFTYDYTIKTFSLFINKKLFPLKEIDSQVRNIDIMPTILEAFDFDKLDSVKGSSLMPLINGSERWDRLSFSETGGLGGPFPSPYKPNVHCVRDGKWKLIYNRDIDTYELYNLVEDPFEENNLINEDLEIKSKLMMELKNFL